MNPAHRYLGACRYSYEAAIGPHRLLIALPFRVEELASVYYGLLDTGCPWCVLPPPIAEEIGAEPDTSDLPIRLETRLGTFEGWLLRLSFHLLADEGEPYSVMATWFVSRLAGAPDHWLEGCLERIRFAMDPSEDAFYFAGL